MTRLAPLCYPVAMIQRPAKAIRGFLEKEAAGGLVLMGAAALAMLLANSPLAPRYFELLSAHIGPMSLLHWIDDGLMAIFFLLVGLEIKREWLHGHLSRWSDRIMPCIAAAAGMAMPAIIYVATTGGSAALLRGWAVPTATDIAFAIGVLTLLGPRVPASLKLFLTTVAIVDDMGAVAIIALAYTAAISGPALLAALLILGAMLGLGKLGVRALWPYLLLALALWLAVLLSGVHATIAGVLAAFAIPARIGDDSPLERLEHALSPWVAFGIVPLFGLANAGVSLSGVGPAELLAPLPAGIAAGLFLGKQIGIFASVRIAVALRLARKPEGASWTQVYGLSLLCGVGFTMSLFIGGLAFKNPALVDEVKIGVLGGSILSALCGFAVLRFAGRRGK
jgi:Na+:H+ antiporter, NhaA family